METVTIKSRKVLSHNEWDVSTGVDSKGLASRFYSQRHLDRVVSDLNTMGRAYYCGPDDIEMEITLEK